MNKWFIVLFLSLFISSLHSVYYPIIIGLNNHIGYSKDNGKNWIECPSGNAANGMVMVSYDGTLWITRCGNTTTRFGGGRDLIRPCDVLYSLNAGLGWHIAKNAESKPLDFYWLTSAQDGTLWGTNLSQEIYYSNNNGINWTRTKSGGLYYISITGDGKTLFGTNTSNLFYMSTDKGDTWTQPNGSARLTNVSTNNDGSKICGTMNGNVWYSTNKGLLWILPNGSAQLVQISMSPDGSVQWGVAGNDHTIWYSTNDGRGWNKTSGGALFVAIIPNAEAFDKRIPISLVLMGVSSGGKPFVSSNNGSSWQQVSGTFSMVAMVPSSITYGLTGLGQLYGSKDMGKTWKLTGITIFKYIATGSTETLYGINKEGKFCFSNDSAKTWTTPTSSELFKKIALAPSGSILAIDNTNQLKVSTNEGSSWTNTSKSVSDATVADDNTWFIINISDQNIEYSTDAGKTWKKTTGTNLTEKLTQITAAPQDRLYGTDKYGRIWHSENGGDTWSAFSTGSLAQIITSRNDKALKLLPAEFSIVYNTVEKYSANCNDLTVGIDCMKAISEAVKAYQLDKANKDKQKALLNALTAYCTYRELSPKTPAADILKDLQGFMGFIKQNKQWYIEHCAAEPNAFLKLLGESIDQAKAIGQETINGITNTVEAAEVVFSQAAGALTDLGKSAIDQAQNTAKAAYNQAQNVYNQAQNAYNQAQTAIESIGNSIGNALKGLFG